MGLPDRWWLDADTLVAEVANHGGNRSACARAHGLGPGVLANAWQRHGLPKLSNGGRVAQVVELAASAHDDSWLLATLKKSGNGASVEQLANHADVSPKRVREALERLGHDGYRVAEEEGERVVLRKVPAPTNNVHRALFAGNDIRFAVISDTHLGSKRERLDELHYAYDVLVDEGITDVYHPGDLVCGMGIFPGQINEVHQHTYDDQVAYAAANYPVRAGITTRIVSGNHDIEGDFGRMGANPVVAFCNQRPDFEFCGDYQATFELEQGTRINLLHPKGGMGYAADYKVRKLAEGFESGTKPNVLLVGHFHRRGAFEARGIQCLLAGCFEGGGSFGARLGMSDPAVGFHIVNMRVGDDGSVVRFNAEWWRFWPGRSVSKAA